jgi:hypothetical protein
MEVNNMNRKIVDMRKEYLQLPKPQISKEEAIKQATECFVKKLTEFMKG